MSKNKNNNDHTRDGKHHEHDSGVTYPPATFYPGISNVVSTGETTGLIPSIPQSENARQALLKLNSTGLPEKRKKNGR